MNSKYLLKVHRSGDVVIVAVCDEEILGKVFREGDVVLNISPQFYGGERVDIDEVIRAIETADIVVISGKRIVEELSNRGFVSIEFALKVGDQYHVQIVREVYQF